MLNLSVEKGFRVTAQSLLPVERTFARGMDHLIIRLAQGGGGREGIATYDLAGLPIPQLVQSIQLPSTTYVGLAGLPIPQLVQCCIRL